jgi:WD40 repeat protein
LLATLKIDRMVNGVNFSSDGKLLATAAAEKSVKLWRLEDLPLPSDGDVQLLVQRGCDWLGDYLAGHAAARSKLPVCQ